MDELSRRSNLKRSTYKLCHEEHGLLTWDSKDPELVDRKTAYITILSQVSTFFEVMSDKFCYTPVDRICSNCVESTSRMMRFHFRK